MLRRAGLAVVVVLGVALPAGCTGGDDPPPPPPPPSQVVTTALTRARDLSSASFQVRVVTERAAPYRSILVTQGKMDVAVGQLEADRQVVSPGYADRSQLFLVGQWAYVKHRGKKWLDTSYGAEYVDYGFADPVELLGLVSQASARMRVGRPEVVEFTDGTAVECTRYAGTADYTQAATYPGPVLRDPGELTGRLKKLRAKRPRVSVCIDDHGLPRQVEAAVSGRFEGKAQKQTVEVLLTNWGRTVQLTVPKVA